MPTERQGEEMKRFECPYCEQSYLSPDGVRGHVLMVHMGKIREFNSTHYPAMEEKFKNQLNK